MGGLTSKTFKLRKKEHSESEEEKHTSVSTDENLIIFSPVGT